MAVHKRGYSRYRGPITGHWARLLVVPRFAWERLLAQRLVVICLLAALVWPLLCAGFIYVVNHTELWPGLPSALRNALKINGNFFLVFMNGQSMFVLVLAALAHDAALRIGLDDNVGRRVIIRAHFVGEYRVLIQKGDHWLRPIGGI